MSTPEPDAIEDADDGQPTVKSLHQDIHGLRQLVQTLMDRVTEMEDELEEERQRRQQLQEELDQQADSTALVQQIRNNGSGTWDGYAAILVETLARKAGEDGVATLDASGVMDALQGQPHRTNCYDIMRHTAGLVDSQMLTFIEEDRSAKRNTRLKLDRTVDDLPRRVAGHELEVSQ